MSGKSAARQIDVVACADVALRISSTCLMLGGRDYVVTGSFGALPLSPNAYNVSVLRTKGERLMLRTGRSVFGIGCINFRGVVVTGSFGARRAAREIIH